MDKPYCNPEIWGGIECTINRVNEQYFDQLTYSGHYNRDNDIEAIAELGISKLRYPVLWEKHQPEQYSAINWDQTEIKLNRIREKNIDVIAGLVHHGSGPSFTNLLDPEFPFLLAEYAKQVALKFPWIEYYTPVNEPLTTARFSGLYGLWYPHKQDAGLFMRMLLNELKGTVLAMREIRKINPMAKLVQTEDLGKTYARPLLQYQADFENERRWLTYDILCGRFNNKHPLWDHFTSLSLPEEDFYFFIEQPCIPDIFGYNHYVTSERFLDERLFLYPSETHGGNHLHRYADVEAVRVEINQPFGLEVLLQEAWERYGRPIAVTEVHLHSHREEQLRWFKQVWETGKKLRSSNVDLKAITSWALLGSYGWDRLLTKPGGSYEPGAFDLRGGKLRPTALASFIKELAQNNECNHHLSRSKGWWERSSRLIYQSEASPVRYTPTDGAPVLIIGKNGTLGKAFAQICKDRCIPFRLLSRKDCDISDLHSIEEAIRLYRPWAVINAAGYVRVDDAEQDQEACFRDNTTGPHNLAMACQKMDIPLLTYSSDLVFDGTLDTPYLESHPVNPLNVYGASKVQAENLVLHECAHSLVIRTSAFFGPWDDYNFASHVRNSLMNEEMIEAASDLFVSPTYVPDLVNASLDLLIDHEKGIWHLANQGSISWADFALEIASLSELNRSLVKPVPASSLHYKANRPSYSVLGSERGLLLPSLDHALRQFASSKRSQDLRVA